MSLNMTRLNQFLWFINERESIRIKHDQGLSKPWTADPVLQQYRFCNVNRNDDKVSRWIYDQWIAPNFDGFSVLRGILLARMINWPDTLAEIGYPHEWDKLEYAKRIRARIDRGEKTWTGAYMITAEANGNPKEVSVCQTVEEFDFIPSPVCYQAWTELQRLPRIGSFMAAQVVADLKRTTFLGTARDYETFCAPGPGSQKGLNILMDTPDKEWAQPQFEVEVNLLRGYIPMWLDAQNVQNCLCEYSKYVRGSSRSKYPGAA